MHKRPKSRLSLFSISLLAFQLFLLASAIRRLEAADQRAFQQNSDGLVVIEAENFHTNTPQGGHQWEAASTPAGFSGVGTLNSLPDSGASVAMPDALTQSPQLDYKINFTKTGTHYLWVRGSDGGGDSIHGGFDDADPTGTTLENIDEPGCCGTRGPGGITLVWINGIDTTTEGKSVFEVPTAGEHTVHLWMREDGMIVDKLLITTDPNFVPTGTGPEESIRVGQTVPPSVKSVTPAGGTAGVALDANIEIVLTEGSAPLATNSIQLSVNGVAVTPVLAKAGPDLTITYDSPTNFPASSRIDVRLVFSDTASPANIRTNLSSFITIRPANTLPPLRQDPNGLLVIEAENFDTNTPAAPHSWLYDQTPAGYSGVGTMYAWPNLTNPDTVNGMPDALTISPHLQYKVSFTQTGTHYLWIRGSDGGGDSVHAGIDAVDPTGSTLDNIDEPGCCGDRVVPGGSTLVWINGTDTTPDSRSTFDIAAAGEHTIHLWMREDGMIVDKILVTKDPNFVPVGQGPPESRHVGEPIPPAITLTSPTNNAVLPGGVDVLVSADASDQDGTIAKVEFFAGSLKIGEDTTAPFSISWRPAVERSYTIFAKATDNSGDTATSASASVIYGNPVDVLFVGNNPTANAGDLLVIRRLQDRGYLVTAVDDNDSQTSDADGKDLVVVSSTVSSVNVLDKYTAITIPIIDWEEAIMDDLLMTGDSGANPDHHGSTTGQTALDIVNPAHPLAAGLPAGRVTVSTSPQTFSWGFPEANSANAIIVATLAGITNQVGIYAYETGATLFDGVTKAPARRVGFFVNADSTLALNAAGLKLLDAAIDWALGIQPTNVDKPILTIGRAGDTVTLSWSGAGRLEQADTVTGPWSDAPSQLNPQNVALSGSAKFFRIRQ